MREINKLIFLHVGVIVEGDVEVELVVEGATSHNST